MSVLNPPEGIKFVIQRRLKATEVKGARLTHQAEGGGVWLDCYNRSKKGYAPGETDTLMTDLRELVNNYPENDYRIMAAVEYHAPTKAAIKAR